MPSGARSRPPSARFPETSPRCALSELHLACTEQKPSTMPTNWRPRVDSLPTEHVQKSIVYSLIVKTTYYEGVARPTTRVPDFRFSIARRSLQCSCSRCNAIDTRVLERESHRRLASSRLNAPLHSFIADYGPFLLCVLLDVGDNFGDVAQSVGVVISRPFWCPCDSP